MTTTDWFTIAAIVIGPIVAVIITLWIQRRSNKRDAKLQIFRILLSTRDLPADPSFQVAIKLIPVEFNDCDEVMNAHQEFLTASNVITEGKSESEVKTIVEETSMKLVRLIFEMSKALGLKIRETDIQSGAFGTRGFYSRDLLVQDSQRAIRDIADILFMQTRLLAGESAEDVLNRPS